jgi:tRNA-splicing ligase RtcB
LRRISGLELGATHNRNEMMDRVLAEVRHAVYGADPNPPMLELQRINSHHNFTQQEQHFGSRVWVTRKGAIEARRSNWAMIPGSMGTRSYIVAVAGREHPMSFHSAPHGAGRRYSRTKARALLAWTT